MDIRRIEEKCSLCMECVRDCAAGVWRLQDGMAVAAAPEGTGYHHE